MSNLKAQRKEALDEDEDHVDSLQLKCTLDPWTLLFNV